MTAHRHRVRTTRTVGYTGPVAQPENHAAHGGVCHIDTCACGAVRKTNSTGMGRDERGPWVMPRPSEGRPESERERVVMSARVLRQAVEAIDARAAADGVSRSALIERWALER